MAERTNLPIGIEDYGRIRRDGFYYVDKTRMVKDLLEHIAYVNLFTRPRRFGKTLNMSMLKYFFEIGSESALFDGLEISKEKDLCDKYMGKFPVISISLKEVGGDSFETAKRILRSIIGDEAIRFLFLAESNKLTAIEQQQYAKLIELDKSGEYAMSDELLSKSLLTLSRFLQKHYGQNTIILIDEYDVPLDKAFQSGYYVDMVNLVRVLFGRSLKTNSSLYFAVLTGCLRISKESIFTGFNNFNVYTIKDIQYNEYFGFSDSEVKKLLEYYGFIEKYDAIKEWYDGYHFGDSEIYCPWDVVSYCHALKMNPSITPQNYWVNTSSNNIIRKFIDMADGTTRDEIELLVNGESIHKKIRHELTYRDLDSGIDNLWSILFTTGYLTQRGKDNDGITWLVIPNREIQWIFVEQIQEWFASDKKRDTQKLESFYRAFEENDAATIEKIFASYLRKTISIRGNNIKKEMKENFYHGIMLGLFAGIDGWKVKSNAESGEGYSDISVEVEDKEIGIIIEFKYAEKAAFDDGCKAALDQINDRNYEERLLDDGMTIIRKYGIACYKKRCRVISG